MMLSTNLESQCVSQLDIKNGNKSGSINSKKELYFKYSTSVNVHLHNVSGDQNTPSVILLEQLILIHEDQPITLHTTCHQQCVDT